jgi:hypothetical protein
MARERSDSDSLASGEALRGAREGGVGGWRVPEDRAVAVAADVARARMVTFGVLGGAVEGRGGPGGEKAEVGGSKEGRE